MNTEQKRDFHVGMVIFDAMTSLDYAAPREVFARMPGAQVHVVSKNGAPVRTDIGFVEVATLSLSETPKLDLLFIGGGEGVNALMRDDEILNFLSTRGAEAQWVTSVCTGSVVLGAAGLLDGYRATSHWSAMEVLPLFGAKPVHERVVVDRNRITGGGVTAGLDFALVVTAKLHGEEVAQAAQLAMEYDPQPPFDVGTPRTAPPALLEKVAKQMSASTRTKMEIASGFKRRTSAEI